MAAKPHLPTAPVASSEKIDAADPTPDNTPLPGGGRWKWDLQAKAWVSADPEPEKSNPTQE